MSQHLYTSISVFRYWHKADTHSHIQTSITYLLHKLCPSLANNQIVCRRQRWWKSRRALTRYDSEAHYSLIISIHVPETDIDLLTPVQSKVDIEQS